MNEAPSERARVRRNPKRARYDRAALEAVLDAGLVAHVAVAEGGQPFCLPMVYVRLGEVLYLHGATSSRLVRALASGAPACVAVTHLDGLVLARSAFHHSMNYRAAVCLGSARLVDDAAEKARALDGFVERMVRGRAAEVRPPSEKELAATAVLAFGLEEASVKIREGGPIDDPEDMEREVWAGVLPLALGYGEPVGCPEIRRPAAPPGAERYGGC